MNSSHFKGLATVLDDLTQSARLSCLVIDASGFAYDEKSGQSFSLNHTGAATIELLRTTGDIDATVKSLATQYNLDPDAAYGEVEAFIRQLAWHLS